MIWQRLSVQCFLACLMGCFLLPAHALETLNLAVFAYREKPLLAQRFQPLASYLSDSLPGVQVNLLVLDQGEIETALSNNGIDLLLTNPGHYLVVRSRNSMAGVLATLTSMRDGVATASLGGVIVVRNDNPTVHSLADLGGKRIAAPGFGFFGGYQAVLHELLAAGLAQPEPGDLRFVGGHEAAIASVLAGDADAAFIRTGILEDMQAQGRLAPEALKVINRQALPSFPYAVSTRLYPEWPLIVMPHLDSVMTRRIASAIFALEPTHPASRAAGIAGFLPPADYLPVENLARALRLPPFDQPVPFSWHDAWTRYWPYLIFFLSGFVVILLVSLRLAASNRKLSLAKAALEQSTQALAVERLHLSTLVRTLPDLVWLKDPAGVYLDCNPRFEAFFGKSREEIVGKTDYDFVDAALADAFRAHDLAAIEAGTPCVNEEWVTFASDGHRELLETTKTPMYGPEGGLIGVLGISHDITERKRLQADLEEYGRTLAQRVEERSQALLGMEQRASLILQTSAAGLYGVNLSGEIIFINPAACQMLGVSVEEAIGQNAHHLFHHHYPDGRPYPAEDCTSLQFVREGRQIFLEEETYWRRDGTPLPVMLWIHPMHQSGENVGAVVSFVDISAQRQAQQAKDRALAAAEHLARMRSEFVANMSHEIRTPLNGILGFADLGLRYLDQPDKIRNALTKVSMAGKHLLGVINDILDFSKIEAGKMHIEQAPIHLPGVLDEAVDTVQELARKKGLSLRLERSPNLPVRCLGDDLRLRQVLLNLLSNAVKFTENGFVSLRAWCEDEVLHLEVEDSGIGMSAAQCALIFDPFVQVDTSSTRRYGGTGLGLSITRRLVELMGGQIQVRSTPEQGTCFMVSLPYLPLPEHAVASSASQDALFPLSGYAVLVAEDNPVNRELLLENLHLAGARVTAVENGRAACDAVAEEGGAAFDVVLMDLQMPVMGGYEATERILAMAPDLPIIGQTAHAYGEERDRCFAVGMVAHIAKPIDLGELMRLIQVHGGARHAARHAAGVRPSAQ